ncbi:Fibrinogen C domain-containing protein 1 [Stylophora pistillata]|uniref:Fibrinogen C domain-containing protein 1 n=1 Tax=Stylophora pistillata TaxID=50429 RepID=A0A2B4R653_STYPI|nr:Fibrinogen C domain-containing protein 1 [Stylophora pistillata]
MRRLKPIFLDVKNIGHDGKKTTVSIPLSVNLEKEPHKSTEEKSQDTNTTVEQDVPLDDLDKQELLIQQQNRVFSISANWEKEGVFSPLYADEATVSYGHTCRTATVKLFRLLDTLGNAGDSFDHNNKARFLTRDKDEHEDQCAKKFGAWWYPIVHCGNSNLNGDFQLKDGLRWSQWSHHTPEMEYSVTKADMKIKPDCTE